MYITLQHVHAVQGSLCHTLDNTYMWSLPLEPFAWRLGKEEALLYSWEFWILIEIVRIKLSPKFLVGGSSAWHLALLQCTKV